MRKSPLLSVKNEENVSISVKKQRISIIFSPSCPIGDKDLFGLSHFYLLGTGFPKIAVFFFRQIDAKNQFYAFSRKIFQ